ncbi:MAG: hypothetical protein A4E55_02379 [Pelotomaculum sp. PtaU1.Bin035]|nr:MAG: hypothetical protein A4E55_02379 [Pelotomaculum sp. PtaU1.Bin035]
MAKTKKCEILPDRWHKGRIQNVYKNCYPDLPWELNSVRITILVENGPRFVTFKPTFYDTSSDERRLRRMLANAGVRNKGVKNLNINDFPSLDVWVDVRTWYNPKTKKLQNYVADIRRRLS